MTPGVDYEYLVFFKFSPQFHTTKHFYINVSKIIFIIYMSQKFVGGIPKYLRPKASIDWRILAQVTMHVDGVGSHLYSLKVDEWLLGFTAVSVTKTMKIIDSAQIFSCSLCVVFMGMNLLGDIAFDVL